LETIPFFNNQKIPEEKKSIDLNSDQKRAQNHNKKM